MPDYGFIDERLRKSLEEYRRRKRQPLAEPSEPSREESALKTVTWAEKAGYQPPPQYSWLLGHRAEPYEPKQEPVPWWQEGLGRVAEEVAPAAQLSEEVSKTVGAAIAAPFNPKLREEMTFRPKSFAEPESEARKIYEEEVTGVPKFLAEEFVWLPLWVAGVGGAKRIVEKELGKVALTKAEQIVAKNRVPLSFIDRLMGKRFARQRLTSGEKKLLDLFEKHVGKDYQSFTDESMEAFVKEAFGTVPTSIAEIEAKAAQLGKAVLPGAAAEARKVAIQATEIAVGDSVKDTKGRVWQVIDNTDPAKLLVKAQDSPAMVQIGRRAVTKVATATGKPEPPVSAEFLSAVVEEAGIPIDFVDKGWRSSGYTVKYGQPYIEIGTKNLPKGVEADDFVSTIALHEVAHHRLLQTRSGLQAEVAAWEWVAEHASKF